MKRSWQQAVAGAVSSRSVAGPPTEPLHEMAAGSRLFWSAAAGSRLSEAMSRGDGGPCASSSSADGPAEARAGQLATPSDLQDETAPRR